MVRKSFRHLLFLHLNRITSESTRMESASSVIGRAIFWGQADLVDRGGIGSLPVRTRTVAIDPVERG